MLPYFPFTGEPYQPSMGLRPLDLATWIEPDDHQGTQLRRKSELLGKERDLVFRAPAETEPACRELYALLADHLPRHHPAHYHRDADQLRVLSTGQSFPVPAPPSVGAEFLLSTLAQWMQEDVCLLSPTAPVKIIAGSVCFPSRWNLAEKFGLDAPAVHAPVPHFQQTLAAPTHHFLERLTVEKPVWRLNWTLHDSDELFAPHAVAGRTDLTETGVLDAVFLRVERQTLRRLPQSRVVVFTIRTHLTPATEIAADPVRRRILLETLKGLPPEVTAYKGMATFVQPLMRALSAP